MPYLAVLVGALGFAAALGLNLDRADAQGDFGKAAVVCLVAVVAAAYAAVELARPTPRAGPPTRTPTGDWYVARGGEAHGPLTVDGLRALAAAGTLTRVDRVRDGRTGAWLPAGAVTAVFPVPSTSGCTDRTEPPGHPADGGTGSEAGEPVG